MNAFNDQALGLIVNNEPQDLLLCCNGKGLKIQFFALLIGLCSLAHYGSSHAGQSPASNNNARQTWILGTGEWPPLTSTALEDGGIATEIVRNALTIEGVNIELKQCPWKRCEALLNQGAIDAVFPYSKNPARERFYDFSSAIIRTQSRFFFLKSRIGELQLTSYQQLKHYTIGGVKGYFYQKDFENAGVPVEYVLSDEQNIKKALSGRIDLFPASDVTTWYTIKKYYPENYHEFSTVPYDIQGSQVPDEELWGRLMVRKDDPQGQKFIQSFNRGMHKFRKTKLYRDLYLWYGIEENSEVLGSKGIDATPAVKSPTQSLE